MFRKLKWSFQRIFRGYSDYDLIDYDQFICRKILPSLKHWVNTRKRSGHPTTLESQEEWENILQEIVWAVEETAYSTCENEAFDKGADYEEIRKIWERTENGMKLLGEYLGGMWI